MAKKPSSSYTLADRQRLTKRLSRILGRLQAADDLVAFLFHALSESEQIMLERRIQIALLLIQGKSARFIAEHLHVGISTVQSVDRWLSSWKDYRTQMPSLVSMARQRPHRRGTDDFPETFRSLRRRYPLHFLFFNLLLDGEA